MGCSQGQLQGVVTLDTHAGRLSKMRRAVLTSCRLLDSDSRAGGGRYYSAFLTLTFRNSEEYSPECISDFIRHVRQWYSRRGVPFRYVWTAELTKRGCLHYHAVCWLPSGLTLPKPDKRGWWPWGMSRIERARHAGAYIAKYVSKGGGEKGAYPKGARIHGAGGLSAFAADERRWWLCPSWVRDECSVADRPFRAIGGGFVLRATGLLLDSPWVVVGMANGFVRLARRLT